MHLTIVLNFTKFIYRNKIKNLIVIYYYQSSGQFLPLSSF